MQRKERKRMERVRRKEGSRRSIDSTKSDPGATRAWCLKVELGREIHFLFLSLLLSQSQRLFNRQHFVLFPSNVVHQAQKPLTNERNNESTIHKLWTCIFDEEEERRRRKKMKWEEARRREGERKNRSREWKLRDESSGSDAGGKKWPELVCDERFSRKMMLMVILMVTMMMSSSLTSATCSYPYNKQQHRSSSSATTSTTKSLSSSSATFYGGRREEGKKKQCLVIQNPSITGGEICHETRLTENASPSDSAKEELSLLELLSKYHLPFCHHYTLNLLTIKDNYAGNETTCSQNLLPILSQLISLDQTAYTFSCEFNSLVSRYNCQSGFSVKWDCDDCRVSHWLILRLILRLTDI